MLTTYRWNRDEMNSVSKSQVGLESVPCDGRTVQSQLKNLADVESLKMTFIKILRIQTRLKIQVTITNQILVKMKMQASVTNMMPWFDNQPFLKNL